MKKTKLILASGLLASPIIATIPFIATSCHKANINIPSSITNSANVEYKQKGNSYYIYLSIKETLQGVQYLPNKLVSVKTGGKELPQSNTKLRSGEEDPNYFTYEPYDNNTKAEIFVNKFEGPISIEGATSKLVSISAQGRDYQRDGTAEFEVGESLTNNTLRVDVKAKLENNDEFMLDKGRYTINLPGFKAGHVFTAQDITQGTDPLKGTVTYANKTSNEFDFRVINVIQAFVHYAGDGKENVTKYTDLSAALEQYNDGPEGKYTINILPNYEHGKPFYEITKQFTLYQKKNTHLVYRSYYDPFPVGKEWEFPIVFKSYIKNQLPIKVEAKGSDTSNSSIRVYGIQYEADNTGAKATDTFSHVVLGDKTHDITFESCNFTGSTKNSVEGVTSETSGSSSGVNFVGCLGDHLTSLFNGNISDTGTSTFDFFMRDCTFTNCRELAIITGENLNVEFNRVEAEVFWETGGGLALPTGGITITGSGDYAFKYCEFTQMAATAFDSAFIEIFGNLTSQTWVGTIDFEGCHLNPIKTDDKMYDVMNSTKTIKDDWYVHWVNILKENEQKTTVFGEPSASGQSTVWTHIGN